MWWEHGGADNIGHRFTWTAMGIRQALDLVTSWWEFMPKTIQKPSIKANVSDCWCSKRPRRRELTDERADLIHDLVESNESTANRRWRDFSEKHRGSCSNRSNAEANEDPASIDHGDLIDNGSLEDRSHDKDNCRNDEGDFPTPALHQGKAERWTAWEHVRGWFDKGLL